MDTRARAGYASRWTTEGTSGEKTVTEAEWLDCTQPERMLEYFRGKASDRKLRLFACACCRRGWDWLDDECARQAVEIAERDADGLAGAEDLAVAWETFRRLDKLFHPARYDVPSSWADWVAYDNAWHAARNICWPFVIATKDVTSKKAAKEYRQKGIGGKAVGRMAGEASRAAVQAAIKAECALIRDIFGNPCHPTTNSPTWLSWHDGLLVSMARRMYDSRDFSDMPVLADGLEEAGCANQDVLSHCRQQGDVHVRGCWVVDSLLGKS
ncbi:MAG TPA: hypothetical protein VH643_23565 [Gemmataceae bacterium]|jgi:hypothetical protein